MAEIAVSFNIISVYCFVFNVCFNFLRDSFLNVN